MGTAPGVLALFMIGGMPLFLDFYKWKHAWALWKSAVRWFAQL